MQMLIQILLAYFSSDTCEFIIDFVCIHLLKAFKFENLLNHLVSTRSCLIKLFLQIFFYIKIPVENNYFCKNQ